MKEKQFVELNQKFGGSLELMEEPLRESVGRDSELETLDILLNRPETPVAILLGEAGSGKTELVRTYYKKKYEANKHIQLIKVSLGKMSSEGLSKLQNRVENLIDEVGLYRDGLRKENEKAEVYLFIDEIHMVISIFGKGSKLGGDLLKQSLNNPSVPVITATTRNEYDSYILSDEALSRRFKPIELPSVSTEETIEILKSWVTVHGKALEIDESIYELIVLSNELYREHLAEPAKSIDTLETAVGMGKTRNCKIDEEIVKETFLKQYKINLDFKVDIDNVEKILNRRVKGQPLAIKLILDMVKRMAFKMRPSNQPKGTAFFIGSTGIGKTELTKALAEGIFGSENSLEIINMTDYQDKNSEPEFRRYLGNVLLHNPEIIVLCDELEKAHPNVIKTFLPILQEGIVTYREKGQDGYMISKKVSVRNSIIIGTSNKGADMFQFENKYSITNASITQENANELTPALLEAWNSSRSETINALTQNTKGFSPELIGRFKNIIAFRSLQKPTILEIARGKVNQIRRDLKKYRQIELKFKPKESFRKAGLPFTENEVVMYLAFEHTNSSDSTEGGARNIDRLVENELETAIIDAVIDNPRAKVFKVILEGEFKFRGEATVTKGNIKVQPYVERVK